MIYRWAIDELETIRISKQLTLRNNDFITQCRDLLFVFSYNLTKSRYINTNLLSKYELNGKFYILDSYNNGDCFTSAIALQLYGNKKYHPIIRLLIIYIWQSNFYPEFNNYFGKFNVFLSILGHIILLYKFYLFGFFRV